MNRLELHKLTLRNFQGASEYALEPAGADVSVRGQNATGKTTLFNSFTWLLFGKDSLGNTAFHVKTLRESGEPVHKLQHEVEAVLRLGARTITLKRTYHEQYQRKRGQAEQSFAGHTTEYAVDGAPVQKQEYDATVAELVGEGAFRMLTDPMHFAERMHWQERRQALIDVCGEVTDDEVIATHPELADLPEILGDLSMDKRRDVVRARRTEINKELDRIPTRIDEKQRDLPDVDEQDEEALRARLTELREKRATAEQERARIEAGGEVAEKLKALAELEAELQTIANRVTADADTKIAALRTERNDVAGELDKAKRAVTNADRDIREAADEIERLEAQMQIRRERWTEINAEAFEHDESHTCAACGQSLPADKVEAAHAIALEEFNARKARKLAEIDAEGKRLKARHDELMEGCEERGKALEAAEHVRDGLIERLDELDQQLGDMQRPDPTDDAAYQKAAAAKYKLREEIAALAADNTAALEAAAAKLAAIDEQVSGVEARLARIDEYRRGRERIEELARQERRYSAEFEQLERHLYLCDEFEKRRAAMLNEHINERFEHVEFRLFRELVNGGVEPCCDVSYGGVPWVSLNTGAQINAGLDIINTLAAHFGVAAVIFIDHAESVTRFIETHGQQIRLIHREDVEQLEVEVHERETAGAAV